MAELIVAVFDTIAHAETAKMSLRNAGITSDSIQQWGEHEAGAPSLGSTASSTTTSATGPMTTEPQHRGFLSWLFGEDQAASNYETHEHRSDYESHLNAGRTILRIRAANETEASKIMSILERHSPAELETEPTPGTTETTESVATSVGTPASRATVANTPLGTTGDAPIETETARDTSVGINPVGGMGTAANQASQLRGGGEEVIPLSEERLDIGKRVIDKGTTRIRRYTVTQPVEETVTLRDERTMVDRRSPVGGSDPTAFQERTVEVTNTTEEPVVSKEARVVEEVVVRREAGEREETVRDTVRREQVETDKEGATFPDQTARPADRVTETPSDRPTGTTGTETVREPPLKGSAI